MVETNYFHNAELFPLRPLMFEFRSSRSPKGGRNPTAQPLDGPLEREVGRLDSTSAMAHIGNHWSCRRDRTDDNRIRQRSGIALFRQAAGARVGIEACAGKRHQVKTAVAASLAAWLGCAFRTFPGNRYYTLGLALRYKDAL